MAYGKSKQTALDPLEPISRIVTEYTLKNGKQGLFTAKDLNVVMMQKFNCIARDADAGVENEYTIIKREIEYDGVGEIPEGNEAIGLTGKVTETEVTQ